MKLCLLIDDDLDDQEIFKMCLKKIDSTIECKSVGDGIEALELLKDDHYVPHYIFLDINMPRMDGITCLQELKKIKHLSGTKFYLYSTTYQNYSQARNNVFGVELILKPANTAELQEKLSEIFEIT